MAKYFSDRADRVKEYFLTFERRPIMTEKRCYTVKELQEILGISRPSVYELLKRNEFRWILVGGKYRISKKSFDEWLDRKIDF
jgi:excisionase family DNA binding protein